MSKTFWRAHLRIEEVTSTPVEEWRTREDARSLAEVSFTSDYSPYHVAEVMKDHAELLRQAYGEGVPALVMGHLEAGLRTLSTPEDMAAVIGTVLGSSMGGRVGELLVSGGDHPTGVQPDRDPTGHTPHTPTAKRCRDCGLDRDSWTAYRCSGDKSNADPTCTDATHDHSTSSCLGSAKDTNGHTFDSSSSHCRDCGLARARWATVQCEAAQVIIEHVKNWNEADLRIPPPPNDPPYQIHTEPSSRVTSYPTGLRKARPVRDNPQA